MTTSAATRSARRLPSGRPDIYSRRWRAKIRWYCWIPPVDLPHGTLEHCRRYGIELQAWGSLAGGRYSGGTTSPDDLTATGTADETAAVVARIATEHEVGREAVALGWLMRHPAKISPVIGTTNPERIRSCAEAAAVAAAMTRADWWELYVSARGRPVP